MYQAEKHRVINSLTNVGRMSRKEGPKKRRKYRSNFSNMDIKPTKESKRQKLWQKLFAKLVQDSKHHEMNAKYFSRISEMMKTYTNEKGIEINNEKAIHSLDFKKDILALSLKTGEIMIYRLTQDNHVLLQSIVEEKGLMEKLKLSQRTVKLDKFGNHLFTVSQSTPICVYKRDKKEGLFKKVSENKKSFPLKLRTMAWNESSKILATGGVFSDLYLWKFDESTGQLTELETIKCSIEFHKNILFSKNGGLLFVGGEVNSENSKLDIYKKSGNGKWKKMKEFEFERNDYFGLDPIAVSDDGKYLFRGTSSRTIYVYKSNPNSFDYQLIKNLEVEEELDKQISINSLQYADQDESLIAYCSNGTMIYFEKSGDDFLQKSSFKVHDSFVTDSVYCPISRTFLSGSKSGMVKIKRMDDLEKQEMKLKGYLGISEVETMYKASSNLFSCHNSDDLGTILVCDSRGDHRVFVKPDSDTDYFLAKKFKVFGGDFNPRYSSGVSNNGKYIAYANKSEIIIEKKIKGPKGTIEVTDYCSIDFEGVKQINQISFFPGDPHRLVAACDDGKIRIIETKEGSAKVEQELEGHKSEVKSIFIHKDNKMIVSCSEDKTIKVWAYGFFSFGNFTEQSSIDIETSNTEFITMTEDKGHIIAASIGELTIFRINKKTSSFMKSSTHKINEKNGSARILKMAISPTSKHLMTLDSDKNYRIWLINYDHLIGLNIDLYGKIQFCCFSPQWEHSILFKESDTMSIIPLSQKANVQQNYNEMNYYKKIFSSKKYFIDEVALENLILHIKSESSLLGDLKKKGEMNQMQNLYVHSKSSIILICVVSGYDQILKKALEIFGYSPFYSPPKEDPFEIALGIGNQNTLDVFADYFTDNQDMLDAIFDMDLFASIMKSRSRRLQNVAKNCFLYEGRPGDVKIPDMHPVTEKEGYVLYDYFSSKRDLGFRNLLVSKSETGVLPAKIEFLAVKFPVDLNLYSDFCTKYLNIMSEVPEEFLTSDLRFIVREIWKKNIYYILIYTLLNWTHTFLITFMIIFRDDLVPPTTAMTLSAFSIYIYLLLFEIIVVFKGFKEYFSSLLNWLDVFQYIMITINYSFWFAKEGIYPRALFSMIWSTLILTTSGFRALSLLQTFDSVRYMIGMIFESFVDMKGFLIIYFASMMILSCIQISSDKSSGLSINGYYDNKTGEKLENDPNPNPPVVKFSDFVAKFTAIYSYSYGNWDDFSKENGIIYIVNFSTSIFLALVMLNLIIAVISKTFDRFEEKKNVFSTGYMIDILRDHDKFISFFIFKKAKKNKKSLRGSKKTGINLNFLALYPPGKSEFSHVLKIKKVKNDDFNEIVDKLKEEVNMKMEASQEEIRESMQMVKEKVESVEQIESRLGKLESDVGEILQLLRNR